MAEYVTLANSHVATVQMLIPVLHALKITCWLEAAHAYQVQPVRVATIYNKA
jgi:hypothetical protein